MGLTTERKVFIGVLAVASAALIIDQGLLGPKSAEAQDAAPSTELESMQSSTAVSPASISSGISAAELLMKRVQRATKGDAQKQVTIGTSFSLDQLLEPAISMATQQETDTTDQTSPDPVVEAPPLGTQAADLPSISAVMPSSSGGGAVLNGKLVRVGQVGPNGYQLVQVRERGVLLKRDGLHYTVEIPIHK